MSGSSTVDKNRYPDIPEIIKQAVSQGLILANADSTDEQKRHPISVEFVRLVENKGYSMFRLISEEDYTRGFQALKQDYDRQVILDYCHGETLLWFVKPNGIAS